MTGNGRNLNLLFGALAALLFLLFSVSLFKHISYPLLWNDEGDTAMFANRVVEYGYPKVHDGKNVLYVHFIDMQLGVNEHDMFTADPLLCYYWAAPGAWLAKGTEDIYMKTLLMRAPFAATGLLGMIILALAGALLFEKGRPRRLLFYALFFLFGVLSVSLALHLREARYYSPVMLLSACILYVFIKHRLLGRLGFKTYAAVSVSMLFFMFNAFYPTYAAFMGAVGLYEFIELIKRMRASKGPGRAFALPGMKDLKPFVPLLASVLTIIPLVLYFRFMEVARAASAIYKFRPEIYIDHVATVIGYFARFEFLFLALFIKAALAFLMVRGRLSGTAPIESVAEKVRVSNFLSLFFAVHVLVTAINPLTMFTRYFVVLIPVLALILLLDAFSVFEILGSSSQESVNKRRQRAFVLAAAAIFIVNGLVANKTEDLKGRFYELTNQYKGPLDFIVPYVKENYPKTEELVIAANYEEASLMYYLGSKVVVGYTGNNIWEDLKETPDLIIDRRFWFSARDAYAYQTFTQKANYEAVTLPVKDYAVNNIPELNYKLIPHLYSTPLTDNDEKRMRIYVKK